MTRLTTQELRQRVYGVDGTGGDIYVSPLLNESQISNSAIDIRLGRHFIISRPARLACMDILDENIEAEIASYQAQMFIHFGQAIVLQPGSSALGVVLEYIALPNTVDARVEPRSSWARLDIDIALAVPVHPGYRGCLTLELHNRGPIPVRLYPGARLGQLLVYRLEEADQDPRGRKYLIPTRPEFTRVQRERSELARFRRLGALMQGDVLDASKPDK